MKFLRFILKSPLVALLLLCPSLKALSQTLEDKTVDAPYLEPDSSFFYSLRVWLNAHPTATPIFWGIFSALVGIVAGWLIARRQWKMKIASRSGVVLLVVLSFLASEQRTKACLNVDSQTLDPYYYSQAADGWFADSVRNAMKADPLKHPLMQPTPGKIWPPGVDESNAAARRIISGDAAGALVQLQDIEKRHPGLYQVAANMGTAYELTGNDEEALKWINEGIRRNPQSHMLAEWLHAKILVAKIKLKSDIVYLDHNRIMDLDQSQARGIYDTAQGPKDARGILESFRSQATVRALFIKPKNEIMAHLFAEAAHFAEKVDPASVAGCVELAKEYGLSLPQLRNLPSRFVNLSNGYGMGFPFAAWQLAIVCVCITFIFGAMTRALVRTWLERKKLAS